MTGKEEKDGSTHEQRIVIQNIPGSSKRHRKYNVPGRKKTKHNYSAFPTSLHPISLIEVRNDLGNLGTCANPLKGIYGMFRERNSPDTDSSCNTLLQEPLILTDSGRGSNRCSSYSGISPCPGFIEPFEF